MGYLVKKFKESGLVDLKYNTNFTSRKTMAQIWLPGACSVAVRCKDGVVLGNDTRNTWGYTVNNKYVSKIFPLTADKRIAMSCSGLVGDFQALARIMMAQSNLYELKEGVKITVKAMAKMVANYLYQRKYAPLFANVEIAGFDDTGAKVYTLDAIGSLMEDSYGVSGSSASFAVSILEAEYDPKMTVKQGTELVKKAIRNSIKRDAMSGNAIDIMVISAKGVSEERTVIDELGE
jgi:proteasome beta subunit